MSDILCAGIIAPKRIPLVSFGKSSFIFHYPYDKQYRITSFDNGYTKEELYWKTLKKNYIWLSQDIVCDTLHDTRAFWITRRLCQYIGWARIDLEELRELPNPWQYNENAHGTWITSCQYEEAISAELVFTEIVLDRAMTIIDAYKISHYLPLCARAGTLLGSVLDHINMLSDDDKKITLLELGAIYRILKMEVLFMNLYFLFGSFFVEGEFEQETNYLVQSWNHKHI